MKTTFYHLSTVFCFLGTVVRLYSQGYIVAGGVTIYQPGNIIHVIQNPSNGDYTGFFLETQSPNTFRFDPFADEGVRTFLVSPNDPITLQAIQTSGYPELLFRTLTSLSRALTFM